MAAVPVYAAGIIAKTWARDATGRLVSTLVLEAAKKTAYGTLALSVAPVLGTALSIAGTMWTVYSLGKTVMDIVSDSKKNQVNDSLPPPQPDKFNSLVDKSAAITPILEKAGLLTARSDGTTEIHDQERVNSIFEAIRDMNTDEAREYVNTILNQTAADRNATESTERVINKIVEASKEVISTINSAEAERIFQEEKIKSRETAKAIRAERRAARANLTEKNRLGNRPKTKETYNRRLKARQALETSGNNIVCNAAGVCRSKAEAELNWQREAVQKIMETTESLAANNSKKAVHNSYINNATRVFQERNNTNSAATQLRIATPSNSQVIKSKLPLKTKNASPLLEAENNSPLLEAENNSPLLEAENVSPLLEAENNSPLLEAENGSPSPVAKEKHTGYVLGTGARVYNRWPHPIVSPTQEPAPQLTQPTNYVQVTVAQPRRRAPVRGGSKKLKKGQRKTRKTKH